MQPKVSVIVPIYNVEKYIERCIDSLIHQSLENVEIILVDDGSLDNCPKICDRYNATYKQIKVIHKINGGLSDARNEGIKVATGEYIVFIDADDWAENTMLEKLYFRARKDSADIVVCSYSIDYANNNFSIEKNLSEENNCIKNVPTAISLLEINGMFNVVWNKLYRKKILDENDLLFEIDGVPGEDLLFNCKTFKKIKTISFITDVLYHYMREDEDTLVNKYNPNLYTQVKRFNLERKKLYQYYEMNSKKDISRFATTYIEYISSCIPNLHRKNTKLSFKEKINFYKLLIQDQELKNNLLKAQNSGIYEKLFLVLLKINSPIFMYITYNTLFSFRNSFENVYRIFRKKILNQRRV